MRPGFLGAYKSVLMYRSIHHLLHPTPRAWCLQYLSHKRKLAFSSSQYHANPPKRPKFPSELSICLLSSSTFLHQYPTPLFHTLPPSKKKNRNSRSKSLCPLCVILRPPFSSSCSNTPIFSNACITLRSTLPLAATWCDGLEPRFLVLPWTLRRRPTPTVLRR